MAENEMTMTQKSSTFKRFRDSLQQGIYFIINPFVRFLIRIGVTPNMVTTIGLLGNIAAAAIFVYAGYSATPGTDMNYPLITWGGVVIILFSLSDMLDGQVARLGNMTSTFGAMYDSVLDRYCELFTLGGLSYYLIQTGYVIGALITFVALVGSIMVSYVRARAEGLGLECKVGFMQRPERVVVTTIGALATGITGQCVSPADFDAVNILIFCMAVIAVFANITAFARVKTCRTTSSKGLKGLHNSNHYHDRIFFSHAPRNGHHHSGGAALGRGDKHLRRIPPRTSLHSRDADSAALHHGHFTPFRSGDVALRRLRHLI